MIPGIRTLFRSALIASMLLAFIAQGEDACDGFSWNVKNELALFKGTPDTLPAGKDRDSMPAVAVNKLYQLRLTPQDQVKFAMLPGKKMIADGAFAGLAKFRVPSAGVYRVSIDNGFWIDVVAGGKIISSKDFQGRPNCTPHKIVQFELPAGEELVLQLSGAVSDHVRVSVTPATP